MDRLFPMMPPSVASRCGILPLGCKEQGGAGYVVVLALDTRLAGVGVA